MPRLQVNRETPVASPPLVDIPRGIIEYAQHRYDAIGCAICATNMRPRRADIVNMKPDTPRMFTDFSAIFQRIKNPVDAVIFHRNEIARAQLRPGGRSVEERRRGVRHILLGHCVVCILDIFQDFVYVTEIPAATVNPEGNAHPHILGALDDCAIHAH